MLAVCRTCSVSQRAAVRRTHSTRLSRFSRLQSTKGFSPGPSQQDAPAPSEAKEDTVNESNGGDDLDIERRVRRSKSRRRLTPKVQVVNEQVEAMKSDEPLKPESQAETAIVTAMFFLFSAIILEGLVLAASGFLSEEVDAWIQDVLYPSYSPTVIVFLALSTLYGLFKTGLLPGQKQRTN